VAETQAAIKKEAMQTGWADKIGTGFAAAGGAEVRDSSAVLFRMM
jgi:hypothetical protein